MSQNGNGNVLALKRLGNDPRVVDLSSTVTVSVGKDQMVNLRELAEMYGWSRPSDLAAKLLNDAIDRAASQVAVAHVFQVVSSIVFSGRCR